MILTKTNPLGQAVVCTLTINESQSSYTIDATVDGELVASGTLVEMDPAGPLRGYWTIRANHIAKPRAVLFTADEFLQFDAALRWLRDIPLAPALTTTSIPDPQFELVPDDQNQNKKLVHTPWRKL
jgi:hypothetical protein